MKIIVAGSDTRGATSMVKEAGLWKLYSMLNEKKQIIEWDDKYPLMIDSGAHSWNKFTTTKIGMKRDSALPDAKEFMWKYFDFIKEHKDKKAVWVEFDVYGHLPIEEMDKFYDEFLKLNAKGVLLRVYHPIMDNGTLSNLKKWVDQGIPYLGLGNDSTHLLDEVFTLTKDKVKLHGFAMTKLPLMQKYPFYSVDSTSPLSTVIFGRYTRPVMAFNERLDIVKMKSIECYHEDPERLQNAIIETKKAQDYITKLWKIKGVQWEDIKW